MKKTWLLYFSISCFVSFSLFATDQYFLKYIPNTHSIDFINSATMLPTGFRFDLQKKGKLLRHNVSTEGETAWFVGQIVEAEEGADKVLVTTAGLKIPLLLMQQQAKCSTGRFLLVDSCSPKHCQFEFGGTIIAEQC